MSLIEGIGDEVTLIVGLLTIILVLLIAWLSTHTREIPFFSVIVVELSQRASRRRQQQQIQRDGPEILSESPVNEQVDSEILDSPISDIHQSDFGETVATHQTKSPSLITIDGKQTIQKAHVVTDVSDDSACASGESPVTRNSGSEPDAEDLSTKETVHSAAGSVDSVNTLPDPGLPTLSSTVQTASNSSGSVLPSGRQEDVPCPEVTSNQSEEEGKPSSKTTSPSSSTDITGARGVDSIDDHEGQIRIRLKYLNDTQRLVYSSPSDTIGQFRRAHFSSELAANKLVRLIFNGQDMRNDTSTLQGYNITDNSVIHCLVTQNNQGSTRSQFDQGDGDVQIGSFMLPLFALILAVIWYLRITQKQYFNAVSTLSLAGVTFLFLLGCASAWRGGAANREHQHVD